MPAAPSITFPTEGHIAYHHDPIDGADFNLPNGFWLYSRSPLGSRYDNFTFWRRFTGPPPLSPIAEVWIVAGTSGIHGGAGDGTWWLDCAGSFDAVYAPGHMTDFSAGVSYQNQPYPPPVAPTASFTNMPKEFFEAKTVQFQDTSSGFPTSWSWKYRASDSGDAWVEFSTLKNPTKDFSV